MGHRLLENREKGKIMKHELSSKIKVALTSPCHSPLEVLTTGFGLNICTFLRDVLRSFLLMAMNEVILVEQIHILPCLKTKKLFAVQGTGVAKLFIAVV